MTDTDDSTPFVYFDLGPDCRVKIRKADNAVVSWSPPSIPRARVLAWAKEHERDAHYTWRAWVHCVETPDNPHGGAHD